VSGTKTKTKSSGLIPNLVLTVGTVLATLFSLEAGSYLFGSFEGALHSRLGGTIQVFGQPDSLLFWSLRPYAEAPDGTRWINSDGLRGPEVGVKTPGELRILSLGESSTFAAQMPYEQCYSSRLEQLLNSASPPGQVRVLNAGVPGYTLFQGVQFLTHRGLRLQPDIVLLYFGFNDFLPIAHLARRTDDHGPDSRALNDWELYELRQTPGRRLTSFLTARSNLYRGLLRLVRGDGAARIRPASRSPRVPEDHRQRLLRRAFEFCRDHGIQLVIIIPIYRSFDDHAALLRGFAAAERLPVVDLPAVLPARFTEPQSAYFLDRAHPTPEAHLLIAEEIYDVVSPLVARAPSH
jgi:lysophospholipase L1-like esterase